MRKAEIAAQDARMIRRQHDFRRAADAIAAGWAAFDEVAAVAVTCSVARPLWREVPRFAAFRRAGIAVWHECADLDLVLWPDRQDRLGALRRALVQALAAVADPGGACVAGEEVDVFLLEPGSDRHLGRLCRFNRCPRGRPDCAVPGCGAIAFNRVIPGFSPQPGLVGGAVVLYRRGEGVVRSALELPAPGL